MKEDLESCLKRSAEQVLEEWALMFVDGPASGLESDMAVLASLDLNKSGERCGRLSIAAGPEFATALAENVLGTTVTLEDIAHQCDAIGELLNIISGHFASDFFGPRSVIELSSPKVLRGAPNELLPSQPPLSLSVDGNPLLLWVEAE